MTKHNLTPCPACGETTSTLIRSEYPPGQKEFFAGIKVQTWECSGCGDHQIKKVKSDQLLAR